MTVSVLMRRILPRFLATGLLTLSLAGCATPYGEPNHTGTGALVGGVSGAGLGAIIAHHNPGAGALLGGAVGAITGGLIGNSMDQQARAPGPAYVPPPAPRYVWVNPQWVWNGSSWVWMEGHWAAVP